MIAMPLLSEQDLGVSVEGTIDPLGTYAIGDALAVKLVPGVRERQRHPRFLTATAVSLFVCREFDDDMVAADGISTPTLVFEWYVVEGLVRTAKEKSEYRGLPGSLKARRAREDKVPLSASRYLKSPNVFGFQAVYRRISRNLGLEVSGRLGEFGYNLLSIWVKEQGLDGFLGTVPGPGKKVVEQLTDAVKDGMKSGAVARSDSWAGWKVFRDHLSIYEAGVNERGAISEVLQEDETGHRSRIFQFLISEEGQKIWKESGSEYLFHMALLKSGDERLCALLKAIIAYEDFCQHIEKAYQDCLVYLSSNSGKTSAAQLAKLPGVVIAVRETPRGFRRAMDALDPVGETVRFQEIFQDFGDPLPPERWVNTLMEHHRRVQKGKPPAGKAPWIERFDDGAFMIRPAYRTQSSFNQEVESDEEVKYVHRYRTNPLWSFALDLGLVN